jgi:hypothetical protein
VIDLGQHERVLGNAYAALRAGQDADQALVDAIKEAAAVSGSAWDSIISAVSSRRAQDEYLTVLNLTLTVRKELRECRKVAKFCKRTAQEDTHHVETFTPSVSTISSIQVVLSAERQNAVDALLAIADVLTASQKRDRTRFQLNLHSIPSPPSTAFFINSPPRPSPSMPRSPITYPPHTSALTSPYSFSAQSQSYVSGLPQGFPHSPANLSRRSWPVCHRTNGRSSAAPRLSFEAGLPSAREFFREETRSHTN